MEIKKAVYKGVLIIGVLCSYPSAEAVADGNPGMPKNCGTCEGNQGKGRGNSVPIDGGSGILLAAGAAYGLKKLGDYRLGNAKI